MGIYDQEIAMTLKNIAQTLENIEKALKDYRRKSNIIGGQILAPGANILPASTVRPRIPPPDLGGQQKVASASKPPRPYIAPNPLTDDNKMSVYSFRMYNYTYSLLEQISNDRRIKPTTLMRQIIEDWVENQNGNK